MLFVLLSLFLTLANASPTIFEDVVIENSIIVPTVSQADGSTNAASTSYVDTAVAEASGTPDATNLVKGKVKLAGDLAGTADLPTVPGLSDKEASISAGTTSQYWRGDKSFQTLNTLAVPELTNLYWTQGRFDTAFGLKTTANLSELTNLYWTQARFDTAFSGKTTANLSELTNLYWTQGRFDTAFGLKSTSNLTEGSNLYFTTQRALDAVFSRLNYITNPSAETDTSGWALYDDTGRTDSAFVVDQDITYTSATSGNGGNGQTVSYQLGTSPYAEPPVITCPTANSAVVKWYNGPTLAQNPTATVVKAAWDASCAASMATAAITGTASNRQYITGTVTLAQGGDTAPVNGTGGSPSNLTFTRSTSAPLVETASFLLSKGASSQQGSGVSSDFIISSADRGNILQLSFYYSGSANFAFGSASDVQIYLYDKTNSTFKTLTRKTITGPTAGTVYRFAAQFTASSDSSDYRVILHTVTSSTLAWDLKLDSVTVNATLDATAATQVPKLVLPTQPITGAVTDHMAVMWQDGNTSWRPATMASATDFTTLYGFATNLVGLTADITLRGALDGFSFGPFVGYNQYVDTTAGGISPLPATFTDAYMVMGKGLTSDTIMVEPHGFNRLVTSKGGLLTNGGLNNGTGDVVVAGGTTGQFLRYNTALTNGFAAFTPVATAPIVYTASTSTWSCAVATGSVAGCLAAADFTTFNAKASTASPTFTGTPTLPTGTIAVTQSAGNSTTAVATTAFVTTADNLKAPLASPTFTSDVNSSTGNVLVSTIGKGLQVKTGSNAKIGTAVLVGGTVTVSNTSVTSNSRIFLTSNTDGGTPGSVRVSAKTNSTSFVITSSSVLDTSTVAWLIIESIP